MSVDDINAPFSEDTVAKLQNWQDCGWVHPLTCCSEPMLVSSDGLHCVVADHHQTWVPAVCVQFIPENPLRWMEKNAES